MSALTTAHSGLLRHLRRLLARPLTAAATPATGIGFGDPVIGLITVELHRLRRDERLVTITTRGGHRHDGVRVTAVRRHHAVLHHGENRILLPLRFIEALAPQHATGTGGPR
ncbi:hypothetical protein ACTD5D_10200 [Nocardia takedensis]|uniref:hypothetical protein n=1 Tax=Nocardia takedensis TaxID=259390 RepID=UPI003F76D8BC